MDNVLQERKKPDDVLRDPRVTADLEAALQDYDRVVLVVDGGGIAEKLTDRVIDYLAEKKDTKSRLLLSRSARDLRIGKTHIRRISGAYEAALLAIYRMYDFSDHFCVLEENAHCGSIFNYIQNGKLTWDEAFYALL